MHFPILSLRPCAPSFEAEEHSSERLLDLSFLKIRKSTALEQNKYVIQKTQFSLVICGADCYRWTAYAFDDAPTSEQELLDRIQTPDAPENLPNAGMYPVPDPIARDADEDIIDANKPFWDPREYFIMILQSRASQLLREWDEVTYRLTTSINSEIEVCHVTS